MTEGTMNKTCDKYGQDECWCDPETEGVNPNCPTHGSGGDPVGQQAGEREAASEGKGGCMTVIYRPKGKALEYAPLAVNLYMGCPHGCRYCYGPLIPNKSKKGLTMAAWRTRWHSKTVQRPGVLADLSRDCRLMKKRGDTRPVLMCFACDPYPPDEPEYHVRGYACPQTRAALRICGEYGVTPIILTKGGTRACRDFDVLKEAGGWFGQTCAWTSAVDRKRWEPNAAGLQSRITAEQDAHFAGINTWWSIEPVLDPQQALDCIAQFTGSHFKLGKLSGQDAETRAIERGINWPEYLAEARRILDDAGYREIAEPGVFEVGTYYVKAELKGCSVGGRGHIA